MNAGFELADPHVCIRLPEFAWVPPGQCEYKEADLAAPNRFEIPFTAISSTFPEIPPCGVTLHLQIHGEVNSATTHSQIGSAYAGAFKGHVTYTVVCTPPNPVVGCTRSQGYWKTHASAWPVTTLSLGGQTYSRDQLITLLRTPPRGDISIVLAYQLIAALLNQAAGTTVPDDIATAIGT